MRSLTPELYETLSEEDRRLLLKQLKGKMPDFLREHLGLSPGVAAGPTVEFQDVKLEITSGPVSGVSGSVAEKIAAPARPTGGAPSVSLPSKNSAGLYEIRDPRELAQVSGMVSIPDSGNFANPELPSEGAL